MLLTQFIMVNIELVFHRRVNCFGFLELAAATMPVYLFNDLFAYTTIDISEKIFFLMEEKATIWRSVCERWKRWGK